MLCLLPLLVAAPRITDVSLFQNGYAFVRSEVDVTGSGEIRIEPLPEAVLGTFRFASTPGVTIKGVTVDEDIRSTPETTDDIDALLKINVGKRVILTLTDSRTLEGELIRGEGTTVVLREGTLERTLPKILVREIAIQGSLNRSTERKSVTRFLRILVEATKPGKVEIRCLQPGLGWMPSYEATLEDDKTLHVVGRATVANDLAEIKSASAELVTGAPNLRFFQLLDPLVGAGSMAGRLVNPSMEDFTAKVSSMPDGLFRGNRNVASRGGEMLGFDADAPSSPFSTVEMPTAGQAIGTLQELFRHRLPPLSLRKGARSQYSLFDFHAPYRELYTWDIVLSDDPQAFWRTLRFRNASGRPFAPGPTTVIHEDQILGQDLLAPTPVDGEADLRLTQAADVRGEVLETPVGQTLEKTTNGGDRIRKTFTGTVRITNGKDRSLPVRVRRRLVGEVIDAGGATIRRSTQGLRPEDPAAELTWTLDLAAKKTQTLTYTYRAYAQ